MAAKNPNPQDIGEFDRIRKENAVLRDELVNMREEISSERHTHEQLLKSFQVRHNEDSRKLREEKKLTSKLAEENGELRLELKAFRERSLANGRDHEKLQGSDVNERLFQELSAMGKRLGLLHNDLLSSPALINLDGRHAAKREAGSVVKDPLKKLGTELMSLRALLTAKSSIRLNGVTLPDHREVKTNGMASNSVSGNQTSLPPDDLVHLTGPITEAALLGALQQRSAAAENYTNLGSVMIAMNSFDRAQSRTGLPQSFSDNQRLQTVIQRVTRKLAYSSAPQVIVLSGSGGSGKTFTAQAFVHHLLEQAGGGMDSDICKHFLASVAVIQSLGKAKTPTNSDSSRMGALF